MTTARQPLVLLVADDRTVQHGLETLLELQRFRVMTANSVEAATTAIHQHRPAAAIIDLQLTRGSGRDVVISMPGGAPVIIFSDAPSDSAELERLRPRTRLFQKPYSVLLLIDTLREMLARSSSPTSALRG